MRNHQEQHQDQEAMVTMDSQEIPNLETTHNHHLQPPPSLQDLKRSHYYEHHSLVSKKTYEDEGFIFKDNAYEVIKKPNFLSCTSSMADGEGDTMPPPAPPTRQDFEKNHHRHNIHVSPDEDEGFTSGFKVIKKLNSLSCSSLVTVEGDTTQLRRPPPPQDFKQTHHRHKLHESKKTSKEDEESYYIKNGFEVIKKSNSPCSSVATGEETMNKPPPQEVEVVEETGREKLKRHRAEMAGRVWIPDIWGHEDLLKDWVDCTVFDSSLGNNNIMSARAALIQEGRSTLRIENQC